MKWVAFCVSSQLPAAISPRPGQGRSGGGATANAACCFQDCSCSYRLFEEGLRCILARSVQCEFGFRCALVFFCQLSARCCDHCWCCSNVPSTYGRLLSSWFHPVLQRTAEAGLHFSGTNVQAGKDAASNGCPSNFKQSGQNLLGWVKGSVSHIEPLRHGPAERFGPSHSQKHHQLYKLGQNPSLTDTRVFVTDINKLGFFLWLKKENQTKRLTYSLIQISTELLNFLVVFWYFYTSWIIK